MSDTGPLQRMANMFRRRRSDAPRRLEETVRLDAERLQLAESTLAQIAPLGLPSSNRPPDPSGALPPPLPRPSTTPDTSPLAETIAEELWFGDDDPQRSRADASRSLAATVAQLEGLKPFPVVAQRVLTLLVTEREVQVVRIVELLEKDPALASRVLRLANSSLYRSRVPSSTVEQAIVRVGTNQLEEMLAGIAVVTMFSDVKGVGRSFRDHCAGVGAIAKIIAQRRGFEGAGQVFLAGLMHDVGKLLCLQVGEFSYADLPTAIRATADETHLHERSALGWDHAVLGAHVLRAWKIPEPIPQVVGWHHQPGRAFDEGGDVAVMTACVRLADFIEKRLAEGGELDDEFLEGLARDPSSHYVGADADFFRAQRDLIAEVRHEALELFA